MLSSLLPILLLALGLAGFVGFARFDFPKMSDESFPNWLADTWDRRTLVQGGIALDPSGWSENADGYKNASSGEIVGRTEAEANSGAGFTPVSDNARNIGTADDTNDEFMIPGVDLTEAFKRDVNRVFEVKGSTGNDGTYEVDSVSYDGSDTTVSVRGSISDGTGDGQIHIVTDDEVYIVAHDKMYLRESNTVAAVRRGAQIRLNQLPNFSSLSEPVLRWLKQNFEPVPGTRT